MTKSLVAAARTETSKGANNRLRRDGRIPAIVYGHGQPSLISVDAREFNNQFKKISENEIISIKVDKAEHKVLIKDYQRNVVRGEISHLDFYEIEKGHKLKTHVPIKTTGIPVGVRDGGILENNLHELEIECVSENLPETIILDISGLTAGHAIHVRDIKVPEGVRILNSADQVVASLTHARAETSATTTEAAPVAAPAAKKE